MREITGNKWNTPINPVKKPDGSYRFVQDLRAVNNLIVPIAPVVSECHVSCVLCHAFLLLYHPMQNIFLLFTLPMHFFLRSCGRRGTAHSCFQNCQKTWCRMPQGYVDSPVVYSVVLQAILRSWTPCHRSVLLQYVD